MGNQCNYEDFSTTFFSCTLVYAYVANQPPEVGLRKSFQNIWQQLNPIFIVCIAIPVIRVKTLYCSMQSFPSFIHVYCGLMVSLKCCSDHLSSLTLFQVTGFFKGMSFPLASITVYNSAVFGFFSNTQRLISNYRYGDGRHPCSTLDLTVASMVTGLMSVGLGAPVDLVKIRLQMQMQMVLAGDVKFDIFFLLLFLFWVFFKAKD